MNEKRGGSTDDTLSASVQYPVARWETMVNLAALSDRDYQQRVWIRGEGRQPRWPDPLSLGEAVNGLYDLVLPNPRDAVGTILVDGPEVERLQLLGQVVGALTDDLKNRPDEDYVRDRRWGQIIDYARDALSAMVLSDALSRVISAGTPAEEQVMRPAGGPRNAVADDPEGRRLRDGC